MPSKSQKQHNLMCAAAHDKEFAKSRGINQKVAKEFCDADARKYKGSKKKK